MTVATALRRACGVAALLGLFAMHGLAVHGATHGGHGAEPTPSVLAVADHGHDQDDVTMADTRVDLAPDAAPERAPGPELMGFAGLCLAVLLVGAVAALQTLLAVTGICVGCRLYFLRWFVPALFAKLFRRTDGLAPLEVPALNRIS